MTKSFSHKRKKDNTKSRKHRKHASTKASKFSKTLKPLSQEKDPSNTKTHVQLQSLFKQDKPLEKLTLEKVPVTTQPIMIDVPHYQRQVETPLNNINSIDPSSALLKRSSLIADGHVMKDHMMTDDKKAECKDNTTSRGSYNQFN